MAQLGVELILAHRPQAKGRVERMNGVLQDRWIKALRLVSIHDLESANRFLEETYWRECDGRFARRAASPLDVHRGVPRNLDEVLSWEAERVVQRDWTVACDGHWYQLDRQHQALSLAGRKVVVRTLTGRASATGVSGWETAVAQIAGADATRAAFAGPAGRAAAWQFNPCGHSPVAAVGICGGQNLPAARRETARQRPPAKQSASEKGDITSVPIFCGSSDGIV